MLFKKDKINQDDIIDVEVEDEIYDWIFETAYNLDKNYISKNQEGIIEIDLIKRLEEISFNEGTYLKLKTLNKIVKKRLNAISLRSVRCCV